VAASSTAMTAITATAAAAMTMTVAGVRMTLCYVPTGADVPAYTRELKVPMAIPLRFKGVLPRTSEPQTQDTAKITFAEEPQNKLKYAQANIKIDAQANIKLDAQANIKIAEPTSAKDGYVDNDEAWDELEKIDDEWRKIVGMCRPTPPPASNTTSLATPPAIATQPAAKLTPAQQQTSICVTPQPSAEQYDISDDESDDDDEETRDDHDRPGPTYAYQSPENPPKIIDTLAQIGRREGRRADDDAFRHEDDVGDDDDNELASHLRLQSARTLPEHDASNASSGGVDEQTRRR
jgi:hypothetical protein